MSCYLMTANVKRTKKTDIKDRSQMRLKASESGLSLQESRYQQPMQEVVRKFS